MGNTTEKPRRLLRTVLVVSLALNVAVIGGVLGMVVSGRAHDGPPPRMMFNFGPLSSVLDPEDRRAIGHTMRMGGARPLDRAELNGKIEMLAATLRAEPFDADAVHAIMASFKVRSEQVQLQAQDAFLARLAAMSPNERAVLADRLEHKMLRKN